ncbi:MAG: hypothetical protein H6671_15020 [Anaerolineaceae bacterium]|nr:hypothetical protein [Anaerolineaceae bacterium]
MTSITSTSELYALEHFYYGQFVKDGKPEDKLQLLAASPGIKPELVSEAVKLALIPPLPKSEKGGFAVIRGKKDVAFIIARSHVGDQGQTVLHYVLPPAGALRAAGGNLNLLLKLFDEPVPAYEKPGETLVPLHLAHPKPPARDQQVDDILALMSSAKNRMDTIESLLAAIVLGVPLVILAAPLNLDTRLTFVQGVLAFLPPSARFGVTFTTHSLQSSRIESQIGFFTGEHPPEDAVIYNWESGEISGKSLENDYAHFIVSQLRLDTELVIKQTHDLTPLAAWRIRRGDTLAEALAYASYRLKVDNAVINRQPVEKQDVAKVLAEDPTLTEDLRVAYGRHMLALSIALGDMQDTDALAITLRQQPELERSILQQMQEAIRDGKAELIYNTLARWLGNPLGPQGTRWIDLVHQAAQSQMDSLVLHHDIEGVMKFLGTVHEAEPGIEVHRMVPKLIEQALPLSMQHRELSETIFLLGVHYLDADTLRRLISSERFGAQLPPIVSRLVPFLNRDDPGMAPMGLLVDTAAAFGDDWKSLVLIRLAEIAVHARRLDLIDRSELYELVQLLDKPWGIQYRGTLMWIGKSLSSDDIITIMEAPGPRYILQLLLGSGAYTELAHEMLHQARVLYPGDLQTDYVEMVQRLFTETPLRSEDIPIALRTIAENGIKSLPLVVAYIGVLEGHEATTDLDAVADEATVMVLDNRTLLDVISPSGMLALLRYHIKRKDINNTIRVAALFPVVAAREGERGFRVVARMVALLDWDEQVRMAGMELLRRYVRQSPNAMARKAIAFFGRELGGDIERMLEATYALKRLADDLNLRDYAEFLHLTAAFLYDTALAYADKNTIPSIGALHNDLDSLGGALRDDDRQAIAQELIGMGRAVLLLGDQRQANKPRDLDRHIDYLLEGKAEPNCILDVFFILGGYLTKGKRYPLKLQTQAGIHPLAERSAPMLKDEVQVVNRLLRSAIAAFPPDKRMTVTAQSLRDEMESLWGDIPLADQREIVRDLAIDFQKVGSLPAIIAEGGTGKAMEDSGLARKLEENKQQPKNTLEFYRFVSGYFKERMR